jgi:hypothetical protein
MTRLRGLLPVSLLCLSLAAVEARAQAVNLLQNSNAELGSQHWRGWGQAAVEGFSGNGVFVLREHGHFSQDVTLPEGSGRKYAVFIGRGASERINPDGAITGLPYLYGYMLPGGEAGPEARGADNGGRVLAYLQGQNMLCSARVEGEWVVMSGIFPVPEGTGRIRFFLKQAERRGVPQNGSAARFDDLGLYLFPTAAEARAFVAGYH